jgi:hypothetical protein
MESLSRIVRALWIAYGLTAANIMPLLLLHFLLPPIAPVIGGYMAGQHLKLSGREALILGLLSGALVGLPLPLLNDAFGLMNYLPAFWIGSLALYAALYCGVIIGGMAWIGGSAARDAARRAKASPSGS